MKTVINFNYSYLIFAVIVSAMGGFLFGYDWIVVGGAQAYYEPFFGITDSDFLQNLGMGSAPIGCIIGAVFSGIFAEKYGRKIPMIVAAVIFTLSALGTGTADSFAMFVIYRIIGGFATAMVMVLSPIYIAEISPAHVRGRYMVICQFMIVIGMLLARLINIHIAEDMPADATTADILSSWNGQTGWRHMFMAEAIFSGVFFLFAFAIPESPRWLLKVRLQEQAASIFRRIGGDDYAEASIAEINETVREDGDRHRLDFTFLKKSKTKTIVYIGLSIAILQQLCGINVIFTYADEIFSAAGFESNDSMFNAGIVNVVMALFTLVAFALMDYIGRRKLMLIGYGSLAVLFMLLGSFYFMEMTGMIMLACVLLGIAVYAMTLAPTTWVVLSEIFPNRVRGLAMSIATFGLWMAGFMIFYFFPMINEMLGASGTFWAYAVICMLGYVLILEFLPEPKGKTLEEVETLFDRFEKRKSRI